MQYDHYDSGRGPSFEHENFYKSLADYPGAEVSYFRLDRIPEIGKARFNQELLDAVKKEKPALVFFFMYSDELDKAILDELKKYTLTLAWFADDSWRFYNYSKFWAKHFTWVVTTYSWMPELYRMAGQPNVIRSQWAANTKIYRPYERRTLAEIPDISFVGGWTRPREQMVKKLAAHGAAAAVYGGGWENAKRVSEAEMLEIFSLSKINLGLNPPPGLFNKNALGRLFFSMSIRRIVPDFHWYANFQSWIHMNVPQIKARHFQVPACGGFVMTSAADDLEHYYEPGKEVVIYKDVDDLAEKAKYYLEHERERKEIARAGYERTIKEHTYERRFREIFKVMGVAI